MDRRKLIAWTLCLPAALLALETFLKLRLLDGALRVVVAGLAMALLMLASYLGRGSTATSEASGQGASAPWSRKQRVAAVLVVPISVFIGNFLFDLGFFPGREKALALAVSLMALVLLTLADRMKPET